jgi:hypothetical protein
LHPVLIETTSKNNNKQTIVRMLLGLGVVLDWIAFMKLLGVETTESLEVLREKRNKNLFHILLDNNKKKLYFCTPFRKEH